MASKGKGLMEQVWMQLFPTLIGNAQLDIALWPLISPVFVIAGPYHSRYKLLDPTVPRSYLSSSNHQHWYVPDVSSRALSPPPLSLSVPFPKKTNPTPTLHPIIGTIGHVAHGKSTVVKAISGVQTVRFKNELERNITIKLGYANAKIYKCKDDSCPRPACYKAYGSSKEDNPKCDVPGFESSEMQLLRHVSFVDCPGHDILMATMLNGAAVMDGALLLIAANEPCPQPQTSEHLAAVEIMRLQHIIILQNKVDLVTEAAALNQHEAISRFIQGTIAESAPVVPISAQLKYNIDAVCEYVIRKIPVPVRDFTSPPQMIVIRSFDVNKPGSEVDELKGGVAGGSILQVSYLVLFLRE